MLRYFYTLIAFVFLPLIIGVGLSVTVPEVLFGEIGVKPVEDRTLVTLQPIPAVLTASNQETYSELVFVGDVLLARNVEHLMKRNGYDYPYRGFNLQGLGINPAIIGNFEATVPMVHKPTPTGMIDFSVSTTALPALVDAGYTHVSLGNNHSDDFGNESFTHTKKILRESFSIFGNAKEMDMHSIAYVQLEDTRIALIGINALTGPVPTELHNVFREADQNSSQQFVFVHWGEEYALRHNQTQTYLAEEFVRLGADLVIGHHPHVVQGVDIIDSVPVFYSLGNYIFDQYFSKEVQEGLVLRLDASEGLYINLIPVTSRYSLSQPHPMDPKEHAKFLSVLAARSHEDLKDGIESGIIDLRQAVEISDKVAIMHDTFEYVQ